MLETKSDFGRRVGRSRQCVNGWIKAGKIDGGALVKQGTNVLIDVDKAAAQLAVRLDAGQRLGNGLGTKLAKSSPDRAAPADLAAAPDGVDDGSLELGAGELDALDEGIKREKLAQLQRINRRGAEEEQARRGRYVLTEDARRQFTALCAQIIRTYEGAIPEIASTVAAKCSVDAREVTIALHDAFRHVRTVGAERARIATEAMPRYVEDPGRP